jgi:DNA-binding MarR family transcriptional regulator
MSATDTKRIKTTMSPMKLNAFFPYQLRRTHASINSCLSEVYEGRFGLTPPEWRVMAIIARDVQITSREIVEASTIDKVAVSRAVTRLENKNLVERTLNQKDRRSVLLTLSPEGVAIYDAISVELLKIEKSLMQGLEDKERTDLIRLLNKIEKNAKNLV